VCRWFATLVLQEGPPGPALALTNSLVRWQYSRTLATKVGPYRVVALLGGRRLFAPSSSLRFRVSVFLAPPGGRYRRLLAVGEVGKGPTSHRRRIPCFLLLCAQRPGRAAHVAVGATAHQQHKVRGGRCCFFADTALGRSMLLLPLLISSPQGCCLFVDHSCYCTDPGTRGPHSLRCRHRPHSLRRRHRAPRTRLVLQSSPGSMGLCTCQSVN
jgi:hypothetical protein